jgi:hypothetical protein
MSLKARLMTLIVLLVTIIVTVLSAVHLNSLVRNWTDSVKERSDMVAQQVKRLLQARIQEKSAEIYPPPSNLEEIKKAWTQIVAEDRQLIDIIRDTMLAAKTIIEVSVADEFNEIVVSSDPTKIGTIMRRRRPFSEWRDKQVTDRLLELTGGEQDYEILMPLGVPQQKSPIFTVQIVESSGLLRTFLLPQLYTLGIITALSLLLSIALGTFSASLAMGPLTRISKEIDRIASGGPFPKDEEREPLGKTRELAIVQSKLNLLGQQIRGAQEESAHLRGNIENLLQRMEEAVLLFDRYDRLILAGPAAERLLEAKDKMLGRRLDDVFSPATPLGTVIQQAVRLGKPAREQLVNFEREDAPPLRLLVNVTPLADRSGTLITLRDAEGRKQLASEMAIARALASIGQLTGGAAHEIKNPLNAIALQLDVLKTKVEETNPEARQQIGTILSEIRRLDRVLKKWLDFNRPVDFKAADVDLVALTRDVTSLVTPQAATQRVTIEYNAEPAECVIRADQDLLKQAIFNVVTNGIEAMKNGGVLRVAVSRTGDSAVLTVQDEGPGIPEADRNRVFHLYYTTKEKGSGIGLATTFKNVQLHNGTIGFTSEIGKGTTFRLEFPLTAQAA